MFNKFFFLFYGYETRFIFFFKKKQKKRIIKLNVAVK